MAFQDAVNKLGQTRVVNVPVGGTGILIGTLGFSGGLLRMVENLTKLPSLITGIGLAVLSKTKPLVNVMGEGLSDALAVSMLYQGLEQAFSPTAWVTTQMGKLTGGLSSPALGGYASYGAGELGTSGYGDYTLSESFEAPALAAPAQEESEAVYLTDVERKVRGILMANRA